MGIFDLIFATSKKIYASKIKEIPLSQFNREVRLTIDGESGVYKEEKLRNILVGMAKGGVTLTKIEDNLKLMGLKNNQIERRKEIIKILENNNQ